MYFPMNSENLVLETEIFRFHLKFLDCQVRIHVYNFSGIIKSRETWLSSYISSQCPYCHIFNYSEAHATLGHFFLFRWRAHTRYYVTFNNAPFSRNYEGLYNTRVLTRQQIPQAYKKRDEKLWESEQLVKSIKMQKS